MPVGNKDTLDCLFVHWNVPDAAAEKHAKDLGFCEIANFRKIKVMNGNDARQSALDSAQEQYPAVRVFWRGNYDFGTTADSAIYRFTYGEYVGDRQHNSIFHADYEK